MNYLNILVTLVSLVVIGLIVRLPKHITDTWLEHTKNKDAHDIQMESYFKQLGGKQQQEVLSKWTEFLTNMNQTTEKFNSNKPSVQKAFQKLIHDTIMYGSDRTVNLVSSFSHSISEPKEKGQKVSGNKMVVYVAFIVASLKADFSGYDIKPLVLLKLMIKDYDQMKSEYEKYATEIQNEIG